MSIDEAEVAVKTFDSKKEELDRFVSDNIELFQKYYSVRDGYEVAKAEVEMKLRNLEEEEAVVGGFKVITVRKVKIDPSKLPDWLLTMPGVVKTVSKAKLRELSEENPEVAEAVVAASVITAHEKRIYQPRLEEMLPDD